MRETTLEQIKKFEDDSGVFISATEALTYWSVYARVLRRPAEGTHPLHHGIKCVTGPDEDSNVLILRDPFITNADSVKSREPMETIVVFVKKAFARIPADRDAAKKGPEEGCGTICG